jgi:hypothetical protein
MSRKTSVPRMVHEPYSLLLPLVQAGVPVSSCVMERVHEPQYLSRFKVIAVSDSLFRPPAAELNTALAAWVRRGGSLIIVGGPEPLDVPSWWKTAGYASPLEHLLSELGSAPGNVNSEEPVGRGCVFRLSKPAGELGMPDAAEAVYLPMIQKAARRAGIASALKQPGFFCLKRGPFLVVHAATKPFELAGQFIDVLDPDLPLIQRISLKPGDSGLYRDVAEILNAREASSNQPRVLHCTHRLMAEKWSRDGGRLLIRGPSQTPAIVRLAADGGSAPRVTASNVAGDPVAVDVRVENRTVALRFPNDPGGVSLEIAADSE